MPYINQNIAKIILIINLKMMLHSELFPWDISEEFTQGTFGEI